MLQLLQKWSLSQELLLKYIFFDCFLLHLVSKRVNFCQSTEENKLKCKGEFNFSKMQVAICAYSSSRSYPNPQGHPRVITEL